MDELGSFGLHYEARSSRRSGSAGGGDEELRRVTGSSSVTRGQLGIAGT
jgi:hypothetical protein